MSGVILRQTGRDVTGYYMHMNADTLGCTFGPDSEYVDLAAEVFALLADPTRVRIILVLRDGELPVAAIAERVGKAPAAVSQHLAKLRWAKVVAARREGTKMYYRLVDGHARRLVQQAVFQAEHAVDDHPRHHGTSHPSDGEIDVCPARTATR